MKFYYDPPVTIGAVLPGGGMVIQNDIISMNVQDGCLLLYAKAKENPVIYLSLHQVVCWHETKAVEEKEEWQA